MTRTDQSPTGAPDFRRSVAVVIGIDGYSHGIPELRTAVADARRVGEILESDHGYDVRLLLDEAASLEGLIDLFTERLPSELGPDDRLFLYYAGHGVALDGDEGPNGYLLPYDARRGEESTFLYMPLLHDALLALACRHVLVIFDSCFSGAFRWSSMRSAQLILPEVIHQERFDRFVWDPAWQVISSSAHDQTALDQLTTGSLGSRGEAGRHSPFAHALFEALAGAADLVPRDGGDGVITATELYLYLEARLQPETLDRGLRQTPRLWPLKKHDKGEFIFLVPGHELNLPPAPPLTYESNPYRGLRSYDQEHADLFFGRTEAIERLRAHVAARPLSVVLGASGTGKSSLVKAGLLPRLAADETERWRILPVVRPGASPLRSVHGAICQPSMLDDRAAHTAAAAFDALARAVERSPEARHVLVIDQLEEVVTLGRDEDTRRRFLELLARIARELGDRVRLVLTLRSDFELSFLDSALADLWREARFVVPPMDLDDLREVIEGPAGRRVLYFESRDLVEALVTEVIQSPGALPLLSFALSEMYIRYVDRGSDDRALAWRDYEDLGGVSGALRFRAEEEYDQLDEAHRDTMRLVLLRMVAFERGALTRRRVSRTELEYPTEEQNRRVAAVLRQLSDQRLLVEGTDESGDAYVEPAHDALVVAWDRLLGWMQEEEQGVADLHLQRRLTNDATEWERDEKKGRSLLWRQGARAAVLGKLIRRKRRAPWLNRTELAFARKSIAGWKLFIALASLVGLAIAGLAASTTVGFLQAGAARDAASDSARVAQEQRGFALAAQEAAADSARVAEAQRDTARLERDSARVARTRAETQARLAKSRQLAALATAARLEARFDRALLLAAEATMVDPTVEARSILLTLLQSAGVEAYLRGPEGATRSLSVHPDGEIMASVDDRGIRLWSLSEREPLPTQLPPAEASALVAFSPDGRSLASVAGGRLTLWDVETWEARAGPVGRGILSVAFSGDGRVVATGNSSGRVETWDVASGAKVAESARYGTERVVDVGCPPASRDELPQLNCETSYRRITIDWDMQDVVFDPLTGGFRSVARDFSLHAFDPVGLEETALRRHPDWRFGYSTRRSSGHAAASNGEGLLATPYFTGVVELWSREADSLPASDTVRPEALIGHRGLVRTVSFSPSGELLATGGADSTIIIWDVATRTPVGSFLREHHAALEAVSFRPGGRSLVSGASEGPILLWALDGWQPRRASSPGVRADSASFRDHRTLALFQRSSVILWDVDDERVTDTVPIASYARAPERGETPLVASATDSLILVRDRATGQGIGAPLVGHVRASPPVGRPAAAWTGTRVLSLAVAPAADRLVSVDNHGVVIVWDFDPASWRERACAIARRNLTREEWDRAYGPDVPYRKTCPRAPPGEEGPSAG